MCNTMPSDELLRAEKLLEKYDKRNRIFIEGIGYLYVMPRKDMIELLMDLQSGTKDASQD